MIQLIKLRIKGAAKGWYESKEHTFKSLKEAINSIEKRFGSNNPFWEFIDKCRDYNPEGKSMKKIGEDFQELVDVAPEFISEQFLAGEFYHRIPVGLTGYIFNNRPPETTTWTQLLDMTYNYENTFKQARLSKQKPNFKINKNHRVLDKKRTIKFFKCNKMGHMAHQCKSPSKDSSKN